MLRPYQRGKGSPSSRDGETSTIPLYELLIQKNTTVLIISDGGADEDKGYVSFGWVKNPMEMQRHRTR
jgi:hypothetical protein